MITLWRGLQGLITNPRETLEGILASRALAVSVALGAAGYYWRMLQVSEALFSEALGRAASLVLNALVALGWMALLALLVHLASRLVGHKRGSWRDLFLLWGFTQAPAIILTVLAMAFLALVPPAWRVELEITWVALGVAIALLLSLWGLILKVQAIKVCYDLSGPRLAQAIVLALALCGIVAWAEFSFVAERGLVSDRALRAMGPTVVPFTVWQKQTSLPFDRLTYRVRGPKRGEIVGFAPPGRGEFPTVILRARTRFIGRVVGMPGDEVEVRNGRMNLGGRPYEEPYRLGGLQLDVPSTKVPAGQYFILGDNRDVALGEYHGGLVPEERLRGRLTEVGRMKWAFLVGKGRW
jgi:signal peptidase I